MKSVTTSAPGKLLLFGDHAVVYGEPCLVTAIDQRVELTVRARSDDLVVIEAPDVNIHQYQKRLAEVGQGTVPQSLQFLETVLEIFLAQYPQKIGFNVETKNQFSTQYGFGSSSAVSVAFAKALTELYEAQLTPHELFQLVYQAVLKVQGVGSGFDIAAAIWGGTLYYVSPAKVVEPLALTELPLIVGYTGLKVSTAKIVQEVAVAKQKDPARIERLFHRSTELVEQAKIALQQHNWPAVGLLMTQNQIMLSELGVSSPELYRLIEAAKKAGAFGSKLSGAGKGDCMIAVADPNQFSSIEEAINKAGGQALSVKTNAERVRIETR